MQLKEFIDTVVDKFTSKRKTHELSLVPGSHIDIKFDRHDYNLVHNFETDNTKIHMELVKRVWLDIPPNEHNEKPLEIIHDEVFSLKDVPGLPIYALPYDLSIVLRVTNTGQQTENVVVSYDTSRLNNEIKKTTNFECYPNRIADGFLGRVCCCPK